MTTQHKPPAWKPALAWTTAIIGGLYALQLTVTGLQGHPLIIIGGLLAGGGFLLPGAWWLYCEKKDTKARQAADEVAQTYRYLTEEDRELLGEPPTAQKTKRHWPAVFVVAFAMLAVGQAFIPADLGGMAVDSTETTTTEAPTPEPTTSTTATTTEEVTTSVITSTSVQVLTVTESASAEPAEVAPVEESAPVAAHIAPEPQPAPAQSAYYANCSAARAAGAAPLYAGTPGYRAGLDRDGDGVACE